MIHLPLLVRLSRRSGHSQHHHVAVLTRGGSVISIGINHGHGHAEAQALNRIWPNQRPGLTLWSYRLTRSGKLAMARPCPDCQKLLLESGVTKICYSDGQGQIQKMRLCA